MAHILLPVDLSDASMHAAGYAVNLFGRAGNRYSLVHAYEDINVIEPSMAMATPGLIKEAQDGLAEFTDRFVRTWGADGVSHGIVFGPLVPLLNDKVATERGDIVVMGREGSGGSFFGSNTVDVVRKCAVPVLVVPAKAPIKAPKSILLADDHAEVSVRDLVGLRMIAERSEASVLVAHLAEEAMENSPHWSSGIYEQALKGIPHSFHTAYGTDAVEGLERLAERMHMDMIAILHRHIGAFARMFHPSTTKELVLHAQFPLLVLEQA